jgi:phospholipid transport system substrate-binding protein
MIKNRYVLSFAAFIWMLFAAMPVLAAGDPVNVLNSIADQLINQLKANKTTIKSNPSLVYSLANRIVVPHADIDEMAKRVLPPRIWNAATPQQRSEFKYQFTTLLVRTYASALAEYNDQTIQFFPVRGGYQGKREVQVNSTIIRSDGPSIAVNYRMINTGSSWRLYDLIVEGVSMLESFRSQFADELSQGNMTSLIQRLREHNSANSG